MEYKLSLFYLFNESSDRYDALQGFLKNRLINENAAGITVLVEEALSKGFGRMNNSRGLIVSVDSSDEKHLDDFLISIFDDSLFPDYIKGEKTIVNRNLKEYDKKLKPSIYMFQLGSRVIDSYVSEDKDSIDRKNMETA